MSTFPLVEVLEARIAPAVFFTNYTKIVDAKNADATNAAAEDITGAGAAVLLRAGDSLVFDINDDQKYQPEAGDQKLIVIRSGRAFVFLTDLDLSGMAVSGGFQASICTTINGPIATVLNSKNGITPSTLQPGSILGLKVTEAIGGAILAGGSISNVRILGKSYSSSVAGLYTGTAAAEQGYSFDGGSHYFYADFLQPFEVDGPSIRGITLASGVADGIVTGDGGDFLFEAVGRGGEISDVKILSANFSFRIAAGRGGGGFFLPDDLTPGIGGQVNRVSIALSETFYGRVDISGGDGGLLEFVDTPFNGAAGGSVNDITIYSAGVLTADIRGGAGSDAQGSHTIGGHGGSVNRVHLVSTGYIGDSGNSSAEGLTLTGGQGGTGVAGGGSGGAVRDAHLELLGSSPVLRLDVVGGLGGESTEGKGGNGGSVERTNILSTAPLGVDEGSGNYQGRLTVHGGDGAMGTTGSGNGGAVRGANINLYGRVHFGEGCIAIDGGIGGMLRSDAEPSTIAGAGGNVSGVHLQTNEVTSVSTAIFIIGGAGGDGGYGDGSGGRGGTLSYSTLRTFGRITGDIQLGGGRGGNGGQYDGNGGAGGSLAGVKTILNGPLGGELLVQGGDAGSAVAGSSTGRNGGNLSLVEVTTQDVNGDIEIRGGDGATSQEGNGGRGGSVNGVRFTNNGLISSNNFAIHSGSGGSGAMSFGNNGSGGTAGDVSHVRVLNRGGSSASISIYSAYGGNGAGIGHGGNGGNVSQIVVDNISGIYNETIFIATGGGGSAADTGAGGNSGSIDGVTVRDRLGCPVLIYTGIAGDGGGARGKGGNSGSISTVRLDCPNSSVTLGAGSAGYGRGPGGGSNGGVGGGIDEVTGTMRVLSAVAASGGPAAGEASSGGNGGSIANLSIDAERASLIVAGDGGSSAVPGRGGRGGSVSEVKVHGDIGDFDATFGFTGSNDMGGLAAGAGGNSEASKNGSIANITADRIAAIVAGRPSSSGLSKSNAVYALSGIHAKVIGADGGYNFGFDFDDTGEVGFHVDEGDVAYDGLVVVRAAGLASLPVKPLMLVKVKL